jgi:hypothetical protein
MRVTLSGLVVLWAVVLKGIRSGPARADDGIDVRMRVEGTILKPNDPILRPFVTDRPPAAAIGTPVNGGFGSDEFCVLVTKDKRRAVAWMNCGGDKKLQEQAAKLAGRRVVVECKGEYKLHPRTVEYELNWVRYKQDVVESSLVLNATKIQPAK